MALSDSTADAYRAYGGLVAKLSEARLASLVWPASVVRRHRVETGGRSPGARTVLLMTHTWMLIYLQARQRRPKPAAWGHPSHASDRAAGRGCTE